MKIKSVTRTQPSMSRCIEVDNDQRLFASGGESGVSVVSHNSVVQRNIVFSCIMRPERWRFLGIDLKKVELSTFRAYSNVVLGIATELEDALTVLRFGQQTMMQRYEDLEQLGLNNFLDLPEAGQALMIMVDEATELLQPSGIKTDEGKAQDELKGEANMIVSSIARLGRAAGVHLVLATQRPDAKVIPGDTKAQLSVRINCGNTGGTASNMILGNSEGTRVKSYPKGRLYLGLDAVGDHGQGFFASGDWIDQWLENKGLNKDGSAMSSQQKSRLANLADMSQFEESTLDAHEGVDNQQNIAQIREEEEGEAETEPENTHTTSDSDTENDDTHDDDSENSSNSLGRPELAGSSDSTDKLARPEDDWDSDLESLIQENE